MATKFLKWVVCPPTLALSAWSLLVARRIYQVQWSSVNVQQGADLSFLNSQTCSTVVNPRRYQARSDTWSIQLRLPTSKKHYSDELILASFARGFFGGWVFAPEGLVLRALRLSLVHFSGTFSQPCHARSVLTVPPRYIRF